MVCVQDHLRRQNLSVDDERFGISADQAADVSAAPQTPSKKSAMMPGDDLVTPEKAAAVNITREAPALNRSMENSLKKLRNEFKKNLPLAVSSMDQFAAHPTELKTSDRVLLSFARTLQFRYETGLRVDGGLKDIRQIVPDSFVSSVGQSGSAPVSSGQAAPATPSNMSVMTGCEQPAEDVLAARKAWSFEDFRKQKRTMRHKFWDADVSWLSEIDGLQLMLDHVLETKDPVKFLEYKKDWELIDKTLQQVAKGIKQAADDLSKHRKAEGGRERS